MDLRIFICYRSRDTKETALRLQASISEMYGRDSVFLDKTIPAGDAYPQVLKRELDNANLVLVLIGHQWLMLQDEHGRRLLDRADDWVRQEIISVLKGNTRLVPILVDNAELPKIESLPGPIKKLAYRTACRLRSTHWDEDLNTLLYPIELVRTESTENNSNVFQTVLNWHLKFKIVKLSLDWFRSTSHLAGCVASIFIGTLIIQDLVEFKWPIAVLICAYIVGVSSAYYWKSR